MKGLRLELKKEEEGRAREKNTASAGLLKVCHGLKVVKELGRGSFGQVMETEREGKIFALKMRQWVTDVGIPGDILREATILRQFVHPNLVKAYEIYLGNCGGQLIPPLSFNGRYQGEIQYLLEYMPSTLQRFVQQYSKETDAASYARDAWKYARDTLDGLTFLHDNSVVHGDLKPDNILLDTEHKVAKLTDFGS